MENDFYMLYQNNLEIAPGKYVCGPLVMKVSKSRRAIIAFESKNLAETARELFSADSQVISAEEAYIDIDVLNRLKDYEHIILFSEPDLTRYLQEKNKVAFDTENMVIPNCYNPKSYKGTSKNYPFHT